MTGVLLNATSALKIQFLLDHQIRIKFVIFHYLIWKDRSVVIANTIPFHWISNDIVVRGERKREESIVHIFFHSIATVDSESCELSNAFWYHTFFYYYDFLSVLLPFESFTTNRIESTHIENDV